MSVVALDTLAVVKRLKAAGFTEDQAEAVTSVVRESQSVDLSDLATEADVASLGARLDLCATKADVAALAARVDLCATKADLRADLADLKSELLKWVIGIVGLQTLAILSAVLAIVRFGAR